MMKRLIFLQILLLSLFYVSAQQDPQITHVFFNKVYRNPAFAGLQGEICVNMIHRQQWVGFEGAPMTTLFTLNAPVNIFGISSGVGLSLTDDRSGLMKDFMGSLSYSYIHNLSSGTLSFGTNLGIYNKAFDGVFETPDGSVYPDDRAIPQDKDQGMNFDMGFGVVYAANDFYVGLSATHLTQPTLNLSGGTQLTYLKRHYFLMSGYKLELSGGSLDLYPNLIIQYDGATPQFVINFNSVYNKKLWGGVTYRTTSELDLNIGIELFNGIKIGYAYGLDFSKLISTNGGSHEVMIGYCFNFEITKAPQKYRSVRFL